MFLQSFIEIEFTTTLVSSLSRRLRLNRLNLTGIFHLLPGYESLSKKFQFTIKTVKRKETSLYH